MGLARSPLGFRVAHDYPPLALTGVAWTALRHTQGLYLTSLHPKYEVRGACSLLQSISHHAMRVFASPSQHRERVRRDGRSSWCIVPLCGMLVRLVSDEH